MKKILAIFLSLTMVFAFAGGAGAAFCKDDPTVTDKTLRFGEDGEFTILQIADLQDGLLFRELTANFIKDLLDITEPDLVVLTGDNIAPDSCPTAGITALTIDTYMSIFEERGVKVALVYGNHDYDRNVLNKDQQQKIYEQYSCFVGRDVPELSGTGTYNLPILASNSDETAFNLWFFDSQEKNKENNLGGYGCVQKDQIQWYVDTEKALTAENGGVPVPSMAFQHIIVPEIYDALHLIAYTEKDEAVPGPYVEKNFVDDIKNGINDVKNTITGLFDKNEEPETQQPEKTYLDDPKNYDENFIIEKDGNIYTIPTQCINEDTFIGENPAPPVYSNGQADALADTGKVLGIVSGHDHVNSFVVPYRGMDIIQSPTTSFGSYGDMNRGARVITLNEADLSTYETDVIFFRDLYDLSDPLLYNRFVFNSESSDYTDADRFEAMLKYLWYKTLNNTENFMKSVFGTEIDLYKY